VVNPTLAGAVVGACEQIFVYGVIQAPTGVEPLSLDH
jgi:hypothetical protein